MLNPGPPAPATPDALEVSGVPIPLLLVRHPRARRYLLRLLPDGVARVTIPHGGSSREARKFAERHGDWLLRQRLRQATRSASDRTWRVGTEILFRGERVVIGPEINGAVEVGDQWIPVKIPAADLRPEIEGYLRALATREFPPRVLAFAARHGLTVQRVTVRNQKSRWGSCSPRGTISLNWRLIQTPDPVRDYIMLHELCHLRHMNHSARFWGEVKRVCPDFEPAETWLKKHAPLLG